MNQRPRVPLPLVLIDIVGMALAALGLAGLFTNAARMFPFLADKAIAGALAAVGFALVTFALGNILRWHKLASADQRARARDAQDAKLESPLK